MAEQVAHEERFPALGAAEPVFDSSLAVPAPAVRSTAAASSIPMQQHGPDGSVAGGTPAAAAGWGAALTAGMVDSAAPANVDVGAWQPYGLWKQQKERLLQTRGQVAHTGNNIPAIWEQQQGQLGEQEATTEQPGSGRQQAAAAGSPFTQHSSSVRRGRVPALPAGSLAAAAEAAAVSASPMARSVRGMAADSPVQSPALHRTRSGAATRPSASPPSGAAIFAAAAAAEVASPQQQLAVAPSPAQLSPESVRFRQQFLPHVRAPAAGAAAAGQEAGGQTLSPGSQLQRRAAAAQAAAVEELEMQRLISEQQLLQRQAGHGLGTVPSHQQAAGHLVAGQRQHTPTSRYAPQQPKQASPASTGAASAARYPQVQQQPEPQPQEQQSQEERMAAALISARLAQAEQVGMGGVGAVRRARLLACVHERQCCASKPLQRYFFTQLLRLPSLVGYLLQMSPLSSLQALRSSIALMAPPPALVAAGGGVAAAWTAQQQQIQGILARLEAQFRWALCSNLPSRSGHSPRHIRRLCMWRDLVLTSHLRQQHPGIGRLPQTIPAAAGPPAGSSASSRRRTRSSGTSWSSRWAAAALLLVAFAAQGAHANVLFMNAVCAF